VTGGCVVVGEMMQFGVGNESTPALEAADSQKEKARKLRKRLHSGEAFMIPEAWDVASARVFADAGHEVVGISSKAMAWSQGYSSEALLPMEELMRASERILCGASVPIIADLAAAGALPPDEVSQAVSRVIAFGCSGVSFSDAAGPQGMVPAEDMAACVKAAKAAAVEAKLPILIAARTQAFVSGSNGFSPFETTVERSEAYFAAGADVVMVPGLQQIQIIERLVGVVDGPLGVSIYLTPAPDFKSLGKAGIACVSLGSTLMRSLLGVMRLRAEELLAFGHFNNLERAIPEEQLVSLLR
jgi:2-methylisocitrate lyase-like PEP mutase family enzyme